MKTVIIKTEEQLLRYPGAKLEGDGVIYVDAEVPFNTVTMKSLCGAEVEIQDDYTYNVAGGVRYYVLADWMFYRGVMERTEIPYSYVNVLLHHSCESIYPIGKELTVREHDGEDTVYYETEEGYIIQPSQIQEILGVILRHPEKRQLRRGKDLNYAVHVEYDGDVEYEIETDDDELTSVQIVSVIGGETAGYPVIGIYAKDGAVSVGYWTRSGVSLQPSQYSNLKPKLMEFEKTVFVTEMVTKEYHVTIEDFDSDSASERLQKIFEIEDYSKFTPKGAHSRPRGCLDTGIKGLQVHHVREKEAELKNVTVEDA